jgi:hypothetical protein
MSASTPYVKKAIEANKIRYQEVEHLEKTRKGKGVYIMQENNLWSVIAQEPTEVNALEPVSNRKARRTSQHKFEKSVVERRKLESMKPCSSKGYKPELWAHSEITWSPIPGFQNEADKRPTLGGRTRFEFEQALKEREQKQRENYIRAQALNSSSRSKTLKSTLPISWEAGTSWNPIGAEQDRFRTNYDLMQCKNKETKIDNTFRKSAARISSSSIKFG